MVVSSADCGVICLPENHGTAHRGFLFYTLSPTTRLVVSTNLFSTAVAHVLIILGMEALEIRWNLPVTEK